MKKIIIYYSFTGNNESLYRELQRRLNCEAFRILEPKRRTWLTILLDMLFDRRPRIELFPVDLRKYDMVILMSPVWNAHIANPMKSFLDKEKDHLKEYAFLTVCGGRQGQKEKLLQELKLLTGKTPAAVAELEIGKLPVEEGKQPKNGSMYRIQAQDLDTWAPEISGFLKVLENVVV